MISSPASCASVSARPCVSTTPTTTSTPSGLAAARGRQHLVGLADARRGAEEDLELAAPFPLAPPSAARRAKGASRRELRPSAARRCHSRLCRASSAMLSCSTLTAARRSRRASGPSMCCVDQLRAPWPLAGRAPWRRAAPGSRPRPARCRGSSPLAEVVTRSIGTGASGFSALSLSTSPCDALDQRLGGRPGVAARRVGGVVGRRHRLGRIVGIGVGGGRRPAMEIAVARRSSGRSARSRSPCRPSRSGCHWPGAERATWAMPVMASG